MDKKKSWLSIIIKTIIAIGLIIISINVYGYLNSSKNNESYSEKKMTIEQIENSNPLKFIKVTGIYDKSFWGTKIKVHGKVINKATIATFKDAIVRITYYSKTKTALGSKDYTIYELFEPNSTKKFELKIKNFKDVNSIGLDIIKVSIK
mgnify:CR=1 FL=1|tara:strand:- start:19801 stop:20247 length:447 start_codon:yes stop_codon:yes gene_type:complete